MSHDDDDDESKSPDEGRPGGDRAPGDEPAEGSDVATGIRGYVAGLVLASALTFASFTVIDSHFLWGPGIPVALVMFAVAQMGVHLVFFIHITTGADSVNNVLALAFGVLIVLLLIVGSLWIMDNLDHNMLPMEQIMNMQR